MGGVFLSIGYSWGAAFPIIKNLWTSSFVLVAAGWSLLLLSVFYLVIDVLRFRRWAFVWAVIGVNAITIYVVPRFVDFEKMADFFLAGVARLSGNWGMVVLAAGVLTAKWLFLFSLYRSRTFLRL
jgi:predicted acyltransferase